MALTFRKKTISLRGIVDETNLALLSQEACMLSRLSGQAYLARELPSPVYFLPLYTLLSPLQSRSFFSSWFSGCLSTLVTIELSVVLVIFIPLALVALLPPGHRHLWWGCERHTVILPRASHLLGTQPWKHHNGPLQRSSQNFILTS